MDQDLTYSRWGRRIIASGLWNSSDTQFAREHGVRHVVLNEAKGWRQSNLDFLHEIPSLRCVEILSTDLASLEPVEHLTNLWGLGLNTVAATKMSFAKLQNLREVGLAWRRKFTGLTACRELRSVVIGGYPEQDVTGLRQSRALTKLCLVGGSLREFEPGDFPNLKALDLSLTKGLANIEGLASLACLKSLTIKGKSKIPSYDVIGKITTLEQLNLENLTLPNINFVSTLQNLKSFGFIYCNILDGKLSVLDQLPHLKFVIFGERRHYDRKRDDFPIDYRYPSPWADPHLMEEARTGRLRKEPIDIQPNEWFEVVDYDESRA